MFNKDPKSLWSFFFFSKWKQVVSIVMSYYFEITKIFNKQPGFEVVTRCFQFPQDNFYNLVFILEMRKVCHCFQQNKLQAQQIFFWSTVKR